MSHPTSPRRVLIVDDVAEVREALRWLIEDEGDFVVVGEAGDGIEALHFARLRSPEIVILDIELPELDGYHVARSLKAMPIPPTIIFLSIHDSEHVRQSAARAGGDCFVQKNEGWPILIGQMRHCLGKS
jgi:DNA-binding NarL/FixJ family response regulator